ncbi:hypothetical protein RJ55_05288 [Drechmeria coniospora]|nr:hypothetical protein RJ55_05288 [Drechmeria coniospora]
MAEPFRPPPTREFLSKPSYSLHFPKIYIAHQTISIHHEVHLRLFLRRDRLGWHFEPSDSGGSYAQAPEDGNSSPNENYVSQ